MKHKVLLISLAVVLAASLGFAAVGCGGGPVLPTSIKVGLVRDLDGLLNVFECGYGGCVYRWYADDVNDRGGIYLSELDLTLDVELVVRDLDLATWDVAAQTEALIDTDGCHFIWGGPGTDCIFTQAPVCNAKGTLFMGLEGGASSMIDGAPGSKQIDSWPYVWPTLSFSNWYQIPVLHDLMVAAAGPNPVVYMTYIGGPGYTHGLEYSQATIDEFDPDYPADPDYIIDAGYHSYDLFASPGEADAIIAKATGNQTSFDIFCAYTYPWNVAALTLACMASNFNPPAILFGPGANTATYGVDFGPNIDGIMSFTVANNDTSPAISNVFAELATQVEADWGVITGCEQDTYTSGWDFIDYWGHPCYVAGLQMWEEAVEAAGNLDSSDVREELVTLNTTTMLGQTWFDVFGGGFGGGLLSYNCHPGEIAQWQSGVYETVGGTNTTNSLIWPNTDNWFWLP